MFFIGVHRPPASAPNGKLCPTLVPGEALTAGAQPGLVDFPHPALGQDFTPSPTARRAQACRDLHAQYCDRVVDVGSEFD
jgi:hypothetical protein